MTASSQSPMLGEVFQAGYVTNDLSRGLEIFGERFGITQFLRPGPRTIPFESGGQMTMESALAWVGNTMYELIQPLADQIEIYTDWLPASGFSLRFHHVGIRLHSQAEWDRVWRQCDTHGHRRCFHLTLANTRALYVDTVADLGHYTEYLHYLDPENSALPRIPQNVPGHRTRY